MHVIRADYQAGMPHLGLAGLSENWLLKECGHQHWLALAKCLGEPQPSFCDKHGRPAYAAFTGLHAESLRLSELDENDHFAIETSLQPISACRFISLHSVYDADGKCLGIITMSSALVSRAVAGDNHTVMRTQIDSAASTGQIHQGLRAKAMNMAKEAKALHLGFEGGFTGAGQGCSVATLPQDWQVLATALQSTLPSTKGLDNEACDGQKAKDFEFYPCPNSDFNGAGFLYFANFQQLADRAEWQLVRKLGELWLTERRKVFFHGNVNPGDGLIARWRASTRAEGVWQYWLQICCMNDCRYIADIFVRKVLISRI